MIAFLAFMVSVASSVGAENLGEPELNPQAAGAPPVIATIPIGATPLAVAVSPASNRIFVLDVVNGTWPYVVVVEGTTNKIIATLAVPYQDFSNKCEARYGFCFYYWGGLAADPGTNRVFAVGTLLYEDGEGYFGAQSLEVADINAATNSLVGVRTVIGGAAGGIGVDPLRHLVYVTANNYVDFSTDFNTWQMHFDWTNSLKAVDETTLRAKTSTTVLSNPGPVALDAVTNQIFVSTSTGVTVISGASMSTVAAIPIGAQAVSLAANPKKNHVYADYQSPAAGGKVAVLDGATDTVHSTTSLPGAGGLDVNLTTNRVYATDSLNAMWVIDGATNSVLTSVTVGNGPIAVAVNQTTGRIYVANATDGTVSVIQD
jgi:YVTN family beta-propeller protein